MPYLSTGHIRQEFTARYGIKIHSQHWKEIRAAAGIQPHISMISTEQVKRLTKAIEAWLELGQGQQPAEVIQQMMAEMAAGRRGVGLSEKNRSIVSGREILELAQQGEFRVRSKTQIRYCFALHHLGGFALRNYYPLDLVKRAIG